MKKFLFILIISTASYSSMACDICGCGVGNYYIGLLPQFRHKFLGLRYHFNNFSTRMANDPTQFSNDYYQTVELWGGWNIGTKWQVLTLLPFNINHQHTDDGNKNMSGLGDAVILFNYKLFDTRSTSNPAFSQQLWVGGGVKLPTGKFEIDPQVQSIAAVANSQIGSGSTDFMLNAIYNIRIAKLGISNSVNYKINTQNRSDFRFGNKVTASSFVLYSLPVAKTIITPNLGMLYEQSASNHLQSSKVTLTGGDLLLASAGAEIGFGKTTVGFNTQLPVAQNFAEGQTKSKVKGMVHITFAF
jgi:hypothetical protein